MLDVYTDKNIFEGSLDDFKFVDKGTYRMTDSVPYKQRFFGGPRSRVFGINPSLQKIPFIFYSGKELFVNDHYYYPWKINDEANKGPSAIYNGAYHAWINTKGYSVEDCINMIDAICCDYIS